MSYEFLIRRAHNCGRYGVKGANADIYRELERDSSLHDTALKEIENNLPRTWGENVKDISNRCRRNSENVADYIFFAIKKVQSNLNSSLTDEDQEVLEQCKAELNRPTFEKINAVIEKAEKVMIKHGLDPG